MIMVLTSPTNFDFLQREEDVHLMEEGRGNTAATSSRSYEEHGIRRSAHCGRRYVLEVNYPNLHKVP